jgi:hypothetical protein
MQTKSIFEEALADARQLKEVAEQNAKNAIINAVTPKIKQLIEMQLGIDVHDEITEGDDTDDDLLLNLLNPDTEGNVNHPKQYIHHGREAGTEEVTSPECEDDEEKFVLSRESLESLTTLVYEKATDELKENNDSIELQILRATDDIIKFKNACISLYESGKKINHKKYNERIRQKRSKLLNLYQKLEENNQKFNKNKFNLLKEKLEITNHLLMKSYDKRINRVQKRLEKLTEIATKLNNNKVGSKVNAKFRNGIGNLYTETVGLENKTNINKKEVTKLQDKILELYNLVK